MKYRIYGCLRLIAALAIVMLAVWSSNYALALTAEPSSLLVLLGGIWFLTTVVSCLLVLSRIDPSSALADIFVPPIKAAPPKEEEIV